MPRTLSALTWSAILILCVLAWHGYLVRDAPLRDGSVTFLWGVALALNVGLYLTSRNHGRMPLVTIWFLGMVVISAACFSAALLRSRSLVAAVIELGACVLVPVVLLAPAYVARRDAATLLARVPQPSRLTMQASTVSLVSATVVDLAVLGVGVLLECMVALMAVLAALEQRFHRGESVRDRVESGSRPEVSELAV